MNYHILQQISWRNWDVVTNAHRYNYHNIQFFIDYLEFLQRYLRRNIMRVNPIREAAKREVLIAPILLEICNQTQTQLNIEYPINISEQLI
ncbi:hypothetical protein [Nostoc sp. DedQUE07]|uniref:hypothetical protein n=1 Tax=Nostoc sp. DedQUE07 TaxID=3075392 RepID=UPI002AD202F9|nr:hypothetical protein [Nostoc sp. DedQUE07]MDZ8131417.1 hypothetical protein [Nostoc sp. DedQUE07]